MALNRNFNVPTTRELIKILANIKSWKSKTPLEKWTHLYGIGRSLCNVIKATPFVEDQTLCWYSYYPLMYISIHFTLVIYTMVHYILNGEPSKGLPCTCIFIGPICGVIQELFLQFYSNLFQNNNHNFAGNACLVYRTIETTICAL